MRTKHVSGQSLEQITGRTGTGQINIAQINIDQITVPEVAELAQRLDQDAYTSPFEGLSDWHLLRAIAFQRPEMVEPYIYLLDLEAYDEA
ncbi:MAG: DUF2555 domain-containing protein [Pegethrix bostrychoides GSE-TBD4-15B]|jgi:hypothetical protein|uniref:DUF2555 domain-containing protein n=1 Tax=Pegethrix bostrychoides GSE-TBD4-15B TaxID=2839662 RepID=A0A951U551_9CYAN|nr:DUF2555 domain-containing protein [Pegethrix bostrychoides GSE-TBD4-15B]